MEEKQSSTLKYNWFAFIFNCLALYIGYSKEFFAFSEGILSYVKTGYEWNSLFGGMSDAAEKLYRTMSDGSLTLMQFYSYLKADAEYMIYENNSDITILVQGFYILIIAFFGFAAFEAVLCLFDKNIALVDGCYAACSLMLFAAEIGLWSIFHFGWEEDFGSSAFTVSAWLFICHISSMVAVVLSAKSETALEKNQEQGKVLEAIPDNTSGEKAAEKADAGYMITEKPWIEYYQKNKAVIAIAVFILLVEVFVYKVMPSVQYSETRIAVRKLAEAFLIGMAVVYASANSFRFMGILALISAGGSMLIYSGNLWYFTWQSWIVNIFHIALIDCMLWLEGKMIKSSSSRIYVMLCTAWIMAVPFYQSLLWGSIHISFGIRVIYETVAMVLPVLFFIKSRAIFVKVFHIQDENIRNCQCKAKKIMVCPGCKKVLKEPGKFCGFCGCFLEEQDKEM